MALILGPILGFRGSDATTWKVSALVVMDSTDKPKLTFAVDGQPKQSAAAAASLATFQNQVVLRFDFDVPRPAGKSEGTVDYEVAGTKNTFFCPGQKTSLQMAYASCNGFSSPSAAKGVPKTSSPFDRWQDLLKKHKRDSERGSGLHFHLLLMGGDQIYGDSVFAVIPELQRWQHLSESEQKKSVPSPGLSDAIDQHYFRDIYCTRWGAEPIAKAMASIPSLMMWDDHDIFDGWGSYDEKWLQSPVCQAIYRVAEKWFRVFQRRAATTGLVPAGEWTGTKTPGFSWFHRIDDIGILAPDLRSERSMDQILSSKTWDDLVGLLDGLPDKSSGKQLKHLLVMSSIPVVYPSFNYAESFLGIIPGHQDLEDDMRDHWRSLPHRGERRRLIRNLLDLAARCGTRVTLISGDVHVPAMGVVQSSRPEHLGEAGVITQLISTGIVHPSGGAIVTWAIDKLLAGFENEVDRDIVERMLELPDTGRRLLPNRNWLALEFSEGPTSKDSKLWARWWLEEMDHAITKVISPVT